MPDLAAPRMRAVDPSLIAAQTSFLGALKLCVSISGVEYDKQIYLELDVDAGHWSRIMSGQAHFPGDKLPAFMDLCQNEAPLLWLLHTRGYDLSGLRRRETETERRLRETQEALEAERVKVQVLSDALAGRRP